MNDSELRQLVIDELEYDPSIEAAHIGVAASKGVITLTGHVADYAQKYAAERAAWRVKGVRAIAEELTIRLPGDKKRNDDEIAGRAVSILEWNTVIPRGAIRVEVSSGQVTLTGQVEWNYQRAAAERAVRQLSGVTGVLNLVEIKPRASTTDVKLRIMDALKRHAEVEAARIEVEVRDDGTVRLEGEVDTWDERRAAELAAWAAPGVRKVEDRLLIA